MSWTRGWGFPLASALIVAANVSLLVWTAQATSRLWPVLLVSFGVGVSIALLARAWYYRGQASVWQELADQHRAELRRLTGNGQ